MSMAARHTFYGRATLLAVAWLTALAVLSLGASWLRTRFDPEGEWREVLLWTVFVMLALLPLLAGAVHRSVRVVTLTALLEALVLGGLLALQAR
jgi:hypothetical protein